MRIPDLESLIEDSEKTSPNHVDEEERQKLIDEAHWIGWAEQQLAEAQRAMRQLPYDSGKDRPIDVVPGSSPLSGRTWTIETTNTSNGRWVDNVPVSQSAPMVQSTMQAPVVMMGSGKIHYS